MFDITSLPFCVAKPFDELNIPEQFRKFTFTGVIDEETLIATLHHKLIGLEASNKMNQSELELIISLAEEIKINHEGKEEILTRIDWLQRLYQAKDEIESVDTKEKAAQIQNLIAPVQICPMKNQLMAELQLMVSKLSEKEIATADSSMFQLLLEKANQEAGDLFVNLGKTGREYVIEEVLKRFGDSSSVDHVKEYAANLEQNVQSLLQVTERYEMIPKLEQFPLPLFSDFDNSRKDKVVDRLIEEGGWNGLFSLDRKISQLNKDIEKEEREKYESENVINLEDGTVVAHSLSERFHEI